MMKAPPPSLESYMQAMLKGGGAGGAAPLASNPAASMAAQTELNKLRQLQAKRTELTQQLQAVDSQIMKVQGALEVLQSLGLVTRG
jgi:hypothetical protein